MFAFQILSNSISRYLVTLTCLVLNLKEVAILNAKTNDK